MNAKDIIEIINAVPEGTNLRIDISVFDGMSAPSDPDLPSPPTDPVDPVDPPEPDPDTGLVQVTNGRAVIKPVGYDEAGKPIMEKTIIGFRVEEGDILQVETPPVIASGGAKFYCIWKGAYDDVTRRGWYVRKDDVKKYP